MTNEEAIAEYRRLEAQWEEDDTSYDDMFHDMRDLFKRVVGPFKPSYGGA